MIIRIGKLQVRLYASILEKRVGVCSRLHDTPEKHMLLWDFDRSEIECITGSLRVMQLRYRLPSIYIIQSSSKGSYHAYCFASRSFREVIHILSDTPEIDLTYLRLGMVRGYYTLRITPRKNEPKFEMVEILSSPLADETDRLSMTVDEYLTSNTGSHNVKKEG